MKSLPLWATFHSSKFCNCINIKKMLSNLTFQCELSLSRPMSTSWRVYSTSLSWTSAAKKTQATYICILQFKLRSNLLTSFNTKKRNGKLLSEVVQFIEFFNQIKMIRINNIYSVNGEQNIIEVFSVISYFLIDFLSKNLRSKKWKKQLSLFYSLINLIV